jgi:glycolate oxidase
MKSNLEKAPAIHHLRPQNNWRSRLKKKFPEILLKDDEQTLTQASTDAWMASANPDIVAYPVNTSQVSQLLRYASSHGIPVTARGAGRGYVGGCVPVHGGIVIDLCRMNKILKIDTRDGIAIVQPGVITGELHRRVERLGWFYPPDPASLDECTIGGNIATNAGGPRCLKYGVTKNYVLALEIVLADGTITCIGTATHKNKCGFDLVTLITGSEGLLAIVTEATLRIIPRPPTRAAIAATFSSLQQAGQAVNAILQCGILPCALEIVDSFTLQAARSHVGTKKIPDGEAMLITEVDGNTAGTRQDLAQIEKTLSGFAVIKKIRRQGDAVDTDIWSIRRQLSYSLRATGLTKFNQDVVVPRRKIAPLIRFAEKLSRRHKIAIACFGHAGDGNIHVNLMVDMNQPKMQKIVDTTLDELFHQVLAWGGTITGEHGIGIARLPWWSKAVDAPARKIHDRIKSAFDPAGILNPGKFARPAANR